MSLEPDAPALEALTEALGLEAVGTAEELVERAQAANKGPNLLRALLSRWPDDEGLQQLLTTWEQDANLQDTWTEVASARDLQEAKAYYVLAERSEEGQEQTRARLLRKLSRALADHPHNTSGEYEIYGAVRASKLLGSGEMATVYRGDDLESGRTVAVKVLKREWASNEGLVEVLMNASEHVRDLRHPQIAAVLEPVRPDDRPRSRPFFVMEYAKGGTLEERIGDTGFDLPARQRAAVRLCEGLAFAHRKGLVHGNLKPSNVLFTEQDEVRLSDFLVGTGDVAERWSAEVIKRVGAPYYAAPEVVGGEPASSGSDVFSLGRLLFRLFTGREENIYDVMVPQTFSQELEQRLGDYPSLVGVIESATALQPESRPASVGEVLAELHRMGGQLGIDAEPSVAGHRSQGAWDELVQARREALLSQPAEAQILALRDIADIQEYVQSDLRGALETWAQAYRTDPGSTPVSAEDELDRLSDELADPEAARAVAEALVAVLDWGKVSEPSQVLRLKLKAAQLFHHQVMDNRAAIPLYVDALDLDSENELAYASLDALYQEEQDWSGLVDLLERRFQTQTDDDERISLLERMAEQQEERIGDPGAAAETYARIRQLDARHSQAFRHLERLLRQLDRWSDVADLLAEEIAATSDPDRLLELEYARANVLESELQEPAEAIQLYSKILAGSPDHEPTIGSLEGLMTADVEANSAAALLEPIYRRQEARSKLAMALEVLLREMEPSDEAWVATLREVATIRENDEANPDDAFDVYARLHNGRPELTWAWDELERVCALCTEPRWTQVVDLYRRTILTEEVEEEPDANFIVALWLRIGEIQVVHLDDPHAAIDAYRAVIGITPRHGEALSHLEMLYQETEQWSALVEVLETQKAIRFDADETAQGIAIMHRVATVWEDKLGQPTRAIETWAEALSIDPADEVSVEHLERLSEAPEFVAAVAEILDPHHTQRQQWDQLLALLERWLELDASLSPLERADMLVRMAEVIETEQNDEESALGLYMRAAEADIERDETHQELARVTAQTGAWAQLVEFYDRLLETGVAQSEERQQIMRLRMAEWYRDELGDLDAAERSFRAVLAINPDHAGALDALDALHTRREQYPRLYEILARKAELAEDPDSRRTLLFRMARLSDDELHDFDRAIDAYRRIVDLGEPDPDALDGLASVYERQEDYPRLLTTLQKRASVEDHKATRIALLSRIGQLAYDRLEDASTALASYEEALSLEPDEPRAILQALADLYLSRDDLEAWYVLLPPLLRHAQSTEERVQLHLRAAELAHRPAAPEQADPTSHYEAILALEPYHPDVLRALERVYTGGQRWKELQDVYRREFVGTHLKAAALAMDRLGDRTTAIEHLRRASDLDPDRVAILDGLLELHQQAGEWPQAAALVERKLTLLKEPAEQGQLLDELAQALENNNEVTRAIQTCVRALEVYPQNLAPLLRLSRLAIYEDRFGELVPSVVERLREADLGSDAGLLLTSVGHLAETVEAVQADDLEGATKALGKVLGIANLPAEQALELMRPPFIHAGRQRAMIEALTAVLKKRGKDRTKRAAIYRAAAELAEQVEAREEAYDLYTRFFSEQPEERVARQEMLRLATELGRKDEAIDAIEARLQAGLEDAELSVELASMLGHIFEASTPGRAINHYRVVLELRPDDPDTLAALDRLYELTENWADLRTVLERRARVVDDLGPRLNIQIRLAELLVERFDEPDRVADVCIDVLDIAPDEYKLARRTARTTLEALARAHAEPGSGLFQRLAEVLKREYARGRQKDQLLELLERQLQLLPEDATVANRHSLLAEMAQWAAEYGETELAFDNAVEAVRLSARDPALVELLDDLARRLDAWDELVALQLELVEREDVPAEMRLELALKAARTLEEPLERPADAVYAYQRALRIDPDDLESLTALERLYIELGQLEDLLELLVARADRSEDGTARRELLERAALLAHDELGLIDRAIACYRRILAEMGPDGPLLQRLRELHETVGEYEQVYQVVLLQLDQARNQAPEQLPLLQLQLGRLAFEQLGDQDRAIPHLVEALHSEPTHDAALAELAELYQQSGRGRELVELLQTQVPLAESAELRLELSLVGARRAEELGSLDAAIGLCEEARRVDPDHAQASQDLYRLLSETGRFPELLTHLESDLERRDGADARVEIALRIAEMAIDPAQLNDPRLGQHYLDMALQIEPNHTEAAQLLTRIYLDGGDYDSALALLGRVIDATVEPEGRVRLLLQRGDIYLDSLGQEEIAENDYNAAFQLDETNLQVVDRLANLLTRRHAWSELIDIYERLARRIDDVTARVDVALKVAGLVEQYELSRDGLIRILEMTLDADPPYPLSVQLILKLIAAYRETGNLDSAAAYVERGLTDPQGATNKAFQAELWYYRGLITQSGGSTTDALTAHETCYNLDNGHVPNLIAFSRLLHQAQQWDEAVKVLQVALLKQSELTIEQKVDVYYMMGMAWVKKGDRRRARDMFNRVLGLNKDHGPTLNALDVL